MNEESLRIPKHYNTKIVIDMETLEVIEKSPDIPYEGPWDLADGAPVDAPPDAPADAGGGDGGGDAPAGGDDGGGGSSPSDQMDILDTPEGDEPPADGGDQPPAEGDEGDVDPNAPPADPNAPVPPKQTPQELAADATLKKAYRENFGQVKDIIKQNPALRPVFFKAAELNEIYPTVEDAKQAKEWASQLYNFDNLYYSNKPEDADAFLSALHENSLEPDGSAPHYDRIASRVVTHGLSNLYSRVQSGDGRVVRAFSDIGLNGKQATVAIQAVAAMLGLSLQGVRVAGGGAGPNGTTASPGNMSEREQWLANEVARLNNELETGKQSTLAQTEQNFYNGIQTTFKSNLASSIAKALEPATALKSQKPGFQTWVKSEIQNRAINAVRSDEFFAKQMEAMSRSGNRGPEHQQQLIAALEQRARLFLPDIVRDVLADAGIQVMQKTNTTRTQAGTPRREPVTGGTPGRLTKPNAPGSGNKSGESYDQKANRLLGIE